MQLPGLSEVPNCVNNSENWRFPLTPTMGTAAHRSTAALARDLGIDCSGSALVQIDEGVLSRLAAHLMTRKDFSEYDRSKWDDDRFWNVGDTVAQRSQYFTVGNSINFRFWSLVNRSTQAASGCIRGEKFVGSMYLWRALRRCIDEGKYPILEARFLASLSIHDFDEIFGDDTGHNPLAVAREDRIANLRDLGVRLEGEWQGQFLNLIAATRGSLTSFVRMSSRFRAFDDPNFKLVMVNAILHSGSGIVVFDGDPLPGIDYHLLKQLLRHGVLKPRAALAEQIRNRELLKSTEGQELRRVALGAAVRLSELTGIGGEILDNKWWWNRAKCKDKDPVCLDPQTAHQCPFYGPCEQLTELAFPIEETRYY